MNFDLNISRLQGCLLSLENKGVLNQLGSQEAITAMRAIFYEAESEARPQMVFFLLLNTQSEFTEQLKDDMNVGLFIEASPTLTKPFFITILFELELDVYISDLIYNCPSGMVVEILEVLVELLKNSSFHKKNYTKFYLHNINKAIFAKVMQMVNEDKVGKDILKILDYFEELIIIAETVIVTPMKLENIPDEMISYTGDQFYNFLKCLISCLKLYNMEEFWEKNEIYEITVEFEKNLIENKEDVKNKLLGILLSHSEKILKAVTLDVWIEWSVYHTETEKTLQQGSGEIIFEIIRIIDEFDVKVTDDMRNCLLSLKIKPVTEDDKISKANIDEMILNINDENSKWRDKWAKALVNFPNVISNEEAAMCLVKNLGILSPIDLKFLMEECLTNLGENTPNHIKSLVLNTFKKLTTEDQLLYLEKILNEYYYNFLKSDSSELTEIFNKISQDCTLESKLFSYALEAPLETVTKICELAVNNSKELPFALDVLTKLKAVCLLGNFHENLNLITFVLKTMIHDDYNSKEEQNLINLITNLQNRTLIDFKFTEKIVLEMIRVEVLKENWTKVVFNLEILKSSLKLKASEYNRVVLLAFMSQVLGHLSWDWTTFAMKKVEGRELTVSIISFLLKGLDDVNEDAQLAWLRQEVSKMEKVNQVYFCDLWLKYDRFFPDGDETYVQFLILLNTKFKLQAYLDFISSNLENKTLFEKRSLIILALVKILPILTAKEWISLFTHLKSISSSVPTHYQNEDVNIHVLDFFVTSLYVMSLVANQNERGFPCLEFCFRNFGRLTQEIITSKKTLGPDAYLRLLKGITFFLRGIRDIGERETCSVILSPIILTSVDCIKTNEGNVDKRNILLWISLLEVQDIEKAVRNKLGEGETTCLEN